MRRAWFDLKSKNYSIIKQNRIAICDAVLLLVLNVDQYVFYTAIEEGAKVVESYRTDRLVVLESVKQATAQVKGIHELVGRNLLFLHRFVEWLVGYHNLLLVNTFTRISIKYALPIDNCLYNEYNCV